MSKYLVKILSLCAIVVLFCVSIVGAAICGTEAVVCTFSVEEAGVLGENAQSNIEVMVNGKQVANKEQIKVAKYTEIKVVWNGDGYEFKGWQKGNYDPDKKFVNTEKAYTFEIKDNTKLFAVEEIFKFNVNFVGEMDDGEPVNMEGKIYEYGEPLDLAKPNTEDGKCLGWLLSDAEANPIEAKNYERAVFDSKYANNNDETNVVYLTPVWADLMRVTLKDTKGNIIKTERYNKENIESTGYVLPTIADQDVAKHLEAGYVFNGWKNADNDQKVEGPIKEFDPNGIVLIMDTTKVDYTVKVKFHAVSDTVTDVHYVVTDGEDLSLKDYKPADNRVGYTLKSATYNGQSYTYTNEKFTGLGKAIVENTKVTTAQASVDIVLVWECKYGTEGSFNFKLVGKTIDAEGDRVNVYSGEQQVLVDLEYMAFIDQEGDDYVDLQDDVIAKYMSQFTNVIEQGKEKKLTFTGEVKVSIQDGNGEQTLRISNSLTFAQILSLVESNIKPNEPNGLITVIFMYD